MATSINYFVARNKYNEQDARHKYFLIAVAIKKYFNEVRLFSIFVPLWFSEFSIYFCKFYCIIPIVLLKFPSSMKNSENLAVKELLEVAIIQNKGYFQ